MIPNPTIYTQYLQNSRELLEQLKNTKTNSADGKAAAIGIIGQELATLHNALFSYAGGGPAYLKVNYLA